MAWILGNPAGLRGRPVGLRCAPHGGVAERLKAHAWKVCIRETVSRVRIPLPPPYVLVLIVVFYINSTKLRMSPGRQGQMKEAKAVDAARLQGFGGGSKPFASG